jgi:vancomycin permeability regulator SanA
MHHRSQKNILIHAILIASLFGFFAITAIVITATLLIAPNKSRVLDSSKPLTITEKNIRVGIVLGAGINPKGEPYKELQARLDVGAEAVQKGYVDMLIVSGDNRSQNYDEPTAMKDYLVNKRGVEPAKIQPDFAGRSTYESCERAVKVFQQKRLIIISAESHLPRAIFLCKHFGIESYGLASHIEANNSARREALARVKAMYNVYIHGEPTVLGEQVIL